MTVVCGIERDVVSFVGCPSMPINYVTLEMCPSGRIFAAQSSQVDRACRVSCHQFIIDNLAAAKLDAIHVVIVFRPR